MIDVALRFLILICLLLKAKYPSSVDKVTATSFPIIYLSGSSGIKGCFSGSVIIGVTLFCALSIYTALFSFSFATSFEIVVARNE